jgi:hypothetical protein
VDHRGAGPETSWQFRSVSVPEPMVAGIHALTQAVVEEGQSLGDVAELLRRMGDLLCQPVPLSSSRPPAKLVMLAAILPLAARVKKVASDIELRMLLILADAGVALEFEMGREIPVQYHDRCSENEWGLSKPDFYHPRKRLAIFCDSEAHHSSPEARARDNGVLSALQHKKITTLRFTSGQILKEPIAVGRMVLAHLTNRPSTRKPISSNGRNAA